ncbi:MAG: hypothetical protein HWD61_03955 [Parachlamydiaceae bacterium]|nr:MAG: hypothetical protein HWD61_03955 [Parachlamydiaceae bacterium]
MTKITHAIHQNPLEISGPIEKPTEQNTAKKLRTKKFKKPSKNLLILTTVLVELVTSLNHSFQGLLQFRVGLPVSSRNASVAMKNSK